MAQKTPPEWARVKTDLGARLRERVDPWAWDYFVKTRTVTYVAEGRIPLDTLLTMYRALEDSMADRPAGSWRRAASKSVKQGTKATHDERTTALARVFATLADRDENVQAFRRDELGGDLVSWDAVPDWIRLRTASAQTATETLTVKLRGELPPMPFDAAADLSAYMLSAAEVVQRGDAQVIAVESALAMLSYFDPGDAAARDGDGKLRPKAVLAAEGSALWRLHGLAVTLAKQFDWWEAWAVHFVLSGLTPPFVSLTATESFGPLGVARIGVTADSHVAPREVEAAYRTIRFRHRRGPHQPIEAKAGELAAFMAPHYRRYEASGKPMWKDLRVQWNAEQPAWVIAADNRFIGDATTAWRRVTGRRFSFFTTNMTRGGDA